MITVTAADFALHAVMCGAGHNLRLILAALRAVIAALVATPSNHRLACG